LIFDLLFIFDGKWKNTTSRRKRQSDETAFGAACFGRKTFCGFILELFVWR
jgi:hypothetical protein